MSKTILLLSTFGTYAAATSVAGFAVEQDTKVSGATPTKITYKFIPTAATPLVEEEKFVIIHKGEHRYTAGPVVCTPFTAGCTGGCGTLTCVAVVDPSSTMSKLDCVLGSAPAGKAAIVAGVENHVVCTSGIKANGAAGVQQVSITTDKDTAASTYLGLTYSQNPLTPKCLQDGKVTPFTKANKAYQEPCACTVTDSCWSGSVCSPLETKGQLMCKCTPTAAHLCYDAKTGEVEEPEKAVLFGCFADTTTAGQSRKVMCSPTGQGTQLVQYPQLECKGTATSTLLLPPAWKDGMRYRSTCMNGKAYATAAAATAAGSPAPSPVSAATATAMTSLALATAAFVAAMM